MITEEAFHAAGDPARFPEQIEAGLRPWSPLKLYRGGVREDEAWNVVVDSGAFDPWLGESYENVARRGLSLQRSQTSGRLRTVAGAYLRYYQRVDGPDAGRESGFFDGIETSLVGLADILDPGLSPEQRVFLARVDDAEEAALAAFDPRRPEALRGVLAEGIEATRAALGNFEAENDIARLLRVKEEQFSEAMHAALGITVTSEALPEDAATPTGSTFGPRSVMGPAVPGTSFQILVTVTNGNAPELRIQSVAVESVPDWQVTSVTGLPEILGKTASYSETVTVRLSEDAASWTPHVRRESIAQSRYAGDVGWYRSAPVPAATAVLTYVVEGVTVSLRTVVRRYEAELPHGYVARELEVMPALSLRVRPSLVVVASKAPDRSFDVEVDVTTNASQELTADLSLELPLGWSAVSSSRRLDFARAGQVVRHTYRVTPGEMEDRAYRIQAVAQTKGREYRSGYDAIEHDDLATRYLWFVRAYAVRDDLRTHNARLLDYAERGGNLIVLYNTPELVPREHAPFAGELPAGSEEVSEENAPVRLLAPQHPVLRWPNVITLADFEGWVEQRGSKFWSQWDDAYTPVVASFDVGQAPQSGGWLVSRVGEGRYTYFAYALHRQLPYGVPGAYRLLANLLAQGKYE